MFADPTQIRLILNRFNGKIIVSGLLPYYLGQSVGVAKANKMFISILDIQLNEDGLFLIIKRLLHEASTLPRRVQTLLSCNRHIPVRQIPSVPDPKNNSF